ncbi:MAG: YfhO family protein [Leptolinea sp.]|jgi:hypothetical protein|nr:YfhO family protein [Leptolinea sp.]
MGTETKMPDKNCPWWFYSPVYLAPIILFLPALIPGHSLFWGITSIQFIPWHWEALQLLRAGEIPLWNELNGMGAPLAANYQSCLFYPPTWLTFLAGWIGGLPLMAWAHGWLIAGHLSWGGWGIKKLTEKLGFGPVPQLICGLAYGLCAYSVARGSFLTMVQAAAWIPWVLLAASQFAAPVRSGAPEQKQPYTRKAIIGLALAFSGQWLSGHAQLAWYTFLFFLAWIIVGALVNGGVKRLWQIALPVAVSGLIGFCVSSIQLIPTLEYFTQSQRSSALDYQTALSYSFWPWRFITFIFPDIFGNPGNGDYWGYASYWEDAVYIGLLPFVLAFYYVIRQIRKKHTNEENQYQPLFWFCLITSIVILLMALGWNTPVFPWLFKHVLTFGFFNGPARWMIFFDIGLILLAGLGAEEWIKHGMLPRKWVNLGLTGVIAMILSAAAAWLFLPSIRVSFKYAVISAGIFLAGYLVLALLKPESSEGRAALRWRFWIACWLAVDLIWAGSKLNPTVSTDLYSTGRSLEKSTDRYYISSSLEKDLRFKRFFLFTNIRPSVDWRNLVDSKLPNVNLLSGVSMLNNFDPMVPDRYSDFLIEMELAAPEERGQYLALAGVGRSATLNPDSLRDIVWEPVETLPRAWMVHCAEIVEDGEGALRWVKSAAGSGRLVNSIVVERESLDEESCGAIQEPPVGVEDLSARSMHHEYQVHADQTGGWLLITNTWYPGWKVKLDGQPAGLLRADYVFMAVEVTEGNHQIELDFQPVSFTAGLALTTIGLFATTILGFYVKNPTGGSR